MNSFTARVQAMYEELKSHPGREIVVVTHGGVIRTMICLGLGLSVRNYLLFDVRPATLTVLKVYDKGAVLEGLNL